MNRSLVTAAFAALLLGSTRAAVATLGEASPTISFVAWLLLVVDAVAIVIATTTVLSAWTQRPSSQRAWIACLLLRIGWLVASICVFIAWPHSCRPEHCPLLWWLQLFVALPLPIETLPLWRQDERAAAFIRVYLQLACTIGCMVAIAATVLHFTIARRDIGGVDFFLYICVARDMVEVPGDVSSTCYRYFPGVYQFWRVAYRLSNGSLAGLQWSYIALVAANGLVIGGIVGRVTRRWRVACLAAVWYFVLLTRFEGLSGITEPIATLPLLAGVLIWGGIRLAGPHAWWRSLALGTGIGLSVVCKQQAGVLAIAASTLVLDQLISTKEQRHAWKWLLLLPVTATCVALLMMLLEGQGLTPLQTGLQMVSDYETHGSWGANIWSVLRNDESAALFTGVLIAAWLLILLQPRLRLEYASSTWLRIVAFCSVAIVVSLVQFRTRGYYHYALLATPFLVVGVASLWHGIVWPAVERLKTGGLGVVAVGCVLLFPLFYTGGDAQSLWVWRLRYKVDAHPSALWHESPDVADGLARISAQLDVGESIYVFPTRRNAVHFVLRTRSASPSGYVFRGQSIEEVDWSRATHVIVVDDSTEDSPSLTPQVRQQIAAALESAGWSAADYPGRMTLYSR